MTTDMVPKDAVSMMERVLVQGDLHQLSAAQRLDYYQRVCASLGLNPLTRPFLYITLNGRLVLYAAKDCTEQLRRSRSISIEEMTQATHESLGVYVVTVKARDKDGRTDIATGVVSIKGLVGEPLANAYMKAETKAKRRVTLSISGLGILDESEADSVPGASVVHVDMATGEIKAATAPSVPQAAVVAPKPTPAPRKAAAVPLAQPAMTTPEQDRATVAQAVASRYPDLASIPLDLPEVSADGKGPSFWGYAIRIWGGTPPMQTRVEATARLRALLGEYPGRYREVKKQTWRDVLVEAVQRSQARDARDATPDPVGIAEDEG